MKVNFNQLVRFESQTSMSIPSWIDAESIWSERLARSAASSSEIWLPVDLGHPLPHPSTHRQRLQEGVVAAWCKIDKGPSSVLPNAPQKPRPMVGATLVPGALRLASASATSEYKCRGDLIKSSRNDKCRGKM
jgi:hypothetical protein